MTAPKLYDGPLLDEVARLWALHYDTIAISKMIGEAEPLVERVLNNLLDSKQAILHGGKNPANNQICRV